MKFVTAFQRQLRRPSGFFGRYLLTRLWNRWNRELHKVAFRSLDVRPSDRVLEIGFGGGWLMGRIHPMFETGFIAGVDHSLAVCRHCAAHFRRAVREGRLGLGCADDGTLPFACGTFDKAVSVNSVIFWPDPWSAFLEVARVLKPGGTHVVVFTDPEALKNRLGDTDVLAAASTSEVRRWLRGTGFQIVDAAQHGDRHRSFHSIVSKKTRSTEG